MIPVVQKYVGLRVRQRIVPNSKLTMVYTLNTLIARLASVMLPLRFTQLPRSLESMPKDFDMRGWWDVNLGNLVLGLAYDWNSHPLDWHRTFALTESTSKGSLLEKICCCVSVVYIRRLAYKLRGHNRTNYENDVDIVGPIARGASPSKVPLSPRLLRQADGIGRYAYATRESPFDGCAQNERW